MHCLPVSQLWEWIADFIAEPYKSFFAGFWRNGELLHRLLLKLSYDNNILALAICYFNSFQCLVALESSRTEASSWKHGS
ncbi:hypothetical protein BN873_30014 [Candidatus Competibacter denitrificans Run_A_D11]|uniref:Uncharacterized protein n=1 Tax=Candidatus Competibacter denitrificans Run_A_D11 TaxID=1400863 RepID=W6M9A8_9GAMM|nr:hypothetical protein BN873_30014 [Candidatus Competibacter denitrificans Run_A_D11]